MIINLTRFFGGSSGPTQHGYVPLSSQWLALDGVEMAAEGYEQHEGAMLFVSGKEEAPDDDDLVVTPNTLHKTPYSYMLTFYGRVDDAMKQEIVGFVRGFYYPFGSGVAKHPTVGKL